MPWSKKRFSAGFTWTLCRWTFPSSWAWSARTASGFLRRLFDGTEVLFPPGTSIAEQADGSWILLNADGSPSSFRMPKSGFYFDDMSFNKTGRIETKNFRLISDIPDEHLNILSQYGRSLYQNTDYAILGWGFGVVSSA